MPVGVRHRVAAIPSELLRQATRKLDEAARLLIKLHRIGYRNTERVNGERVGTVRPQGTGRLNGVHIRFLPADRSNETSRTANCDCTAMDNQGQRSVVTRLPPGFQDQTSIDASIAGLPAGHGG